jgi:hypothetical protein
MATRGIAELRKTPDEKLIEEHDDKAKTTEPTVDYYLWELRRREAACQERKMVRLTQIIAFLTAVVTVATIINPLVFIYRG